MKLSTPTTTTVTALLASMYLGTIVSAEQGPGPQFPSDPDQLDIVTCGGSTQYQCIYLKDNRINRPHWENNDDELASATRKNGERIYVTQPGAKGSITGKCASGSSQIHFDFVQRKQGDGALSKAYFDHGRINAYFNSHESNKLSDKNRAIRSTVPGDDLRVFCK